MKMLVLIMSLLAPLAFGNGKGIGNGGKAVVCKDGAPKAEVFDLFEARALRGVHVKESPIPYAEQAQDVIDRLAKTLGQDGVSDGGVIDLLRRIQDHLIFLPSGTGLEPIPDGAEFIVPKGCTIEQAVNFHDMTHISINPAAPSRAPLFSRTPRAIRFVSKSLNPTA